MADHLDPHARLSVAPMMDWTDRHCRVFHRVLSREALLYTEMVTSAALIRGGALRLLEHDPFEHPVALQLGGSDPAELAKAAKLGEEAGYQEINLNCGCPSDRVQSGSFGAVLMEKPELVADCVAAMAEAVGEVPVTVKCRIGVDDQDPHKVLPDFLAKIHGAGVRRITVHARKAWLQGLSPKDNREIPPLDYDLAFAMKAEFPDMHVSLNGGITDLTQAKAHLARGFDGVMIGRAAYHDPGAVLLGADEAIFGQARAQTRIGAAREMLPYIDAHLSRGGRLNQVTRHMLGLFQGLPGARAWRRYLSENAHREGAGPEVVETALGFVSKEAA
ncbi:MAG: tRNA dihydrouridine(20/20a) synthase DusA [Pseudomonadota bacterium]